MAFSPCDVTLVWLRLMLLSIGLSVHRKLMFYKSGRTSGHTIFHYSTEFLAFYCLRPGQKWKGCTPNMGTKYWWCRL